MIVINTGATANDGLGDKLRDAFIIVNENFESIDTLLSGTDVLTISQITGLQTALNNIQNQLDYIPGLQTDINSINNTIYTINQTLNSQNNSIADLYDEITNLQTQIYTKVEEAPIDGQSYVRKDAGWVLAVTQSGGTYATPSFQEVLQVNNVSSIGLQLNNGTGNTTDITPNIVSVTNATNLNYSYMQDGAFVSLNQMTNNRIDLTTAGIRFRFNNAFSNIIPNALQTNLFEPRFQLPQKATNDILTLATTEDYTLGGVLTAGNSTTLNAVFITGTKSSIISGSSIQLTQTGSGASTTRIENNRITWSRFGNNVTLSAFDASGSNNANYIFPTKNPGTYSLATTADLYSIGSLNANTLNIITSGSGTTVNRNLNVRGLTSSNQTISIVGTGSNVSTNWAWDLRSLNGLPIGGTANQILLKNSGTNYDASWVNTSLLGFVPYTGANNNVNLGTYSLISAKSLHQFTDVSNQFYVERNDYGYNRLYFNTIDSSGDDFGYVNITANPEESIYLTKGKTSSNEQGYLIVAQNIIDATVQSPDYYHFFRMNGGSIDFIAEDIGGAVSNNVYFTPSRSVFSKQTELPKVLFNSITEPSEAQALTWNDTQGTMNIGLKGGQTAVKSGVDLVVRIVNKVTPNATLTKAAYQAVRISGAQGQRLAVEYAQANNDTNSADTIGLVCETIATNQEGYVMTMGQLEGVNTTGSLQGETWVDGDVLYLSPTTAGRLTNIKPVAPGHIVVIGYVEYVHSVNGKIYVKIMNGWELDELHNVNIVGATAGQVLQYNGSTELWENQTFNSGLPFNEVQRVAFLKI